MKSAAINNFIDQSLRIKRLTQKLDDLNEIVPSLESKDINLSLVKNEILMIGKELFAIGGSALLSELYADLHDSSGIIARCWLLIGSWSPQRVAILPML